MKTSLFILIGLVLTSMISFGAPTSDTKWSTEMRPRKVYGDNFVGLELGGRGIAYSLNYDRVINSRLSLGGGFTYYQFRIFELGFDLALIPLYAHYYFGGNSTHRGFLGAGATLAYAKADYTTNYVQMPESNDISYNYARTEGATLLPNLALGYELRLKAGFTARFATYAHYITSVIPWAGITLGAQF